MLSASQGDVNVATQSINIRNRVTEELKDWAHEVRLAAREAAHPDELGEITQEEAKQSLDFMDAFLDYAVALPERRRRQREQGDEGEAGRSRGELAP